MTDETAIWETFVEPDRTLDGLDEIGAIWPARQSYFTDLHVSDAVRAARRALEADLVGHETVFLNTADTNSETPTAELVDECYPESDSRTAFSGHDSLVDTSKAERLLDWTPARSWRDYSRTELDVLDSVSVEGQATDLDAAPVLYRPDDLAVGLVDE